jgi:methyltransferase (TIGR00027 family)
MASAPAPDAAMAAAWRARAAGDGCPFDTPRPAATEENLVGTLSISSLYLDPNQTYRGHCQLVFDPRHVARLDQLTQPEWVSFASDLFIAQQAVMRVVKADHLNVESLGNVVPHLHWHIIPRCFGDARWGLPIWETPLEAMTQTRLPDTERSELLAALKRALTGRTSDMSSVGVTARWVAANRALETESATPLYRDRFARALAGDEGFDMLYAMRAVIGMPGLSGPDPFLTIRTKFLDEALLAAVRDGRKAARGDGGIDQVVILAAGMDARALRLEWPDGVTVFEVDRDDVFAHKEAVLTGFGATPTSDRRVVRHDLADPAWAAALVAAGFDPKRRTAFLAEGLLYYLHEAAALRLLDTVRDLAAAGSWLGLDAMTPDVITSPFMATYIKKLADLGCPWQFGMADPEALLASKGWHASYVLPGEPEAHFGRWTMPTMPRAIPGIPRMYFVRATRAR